MTIVNEIMKRPRPKSWNLKRIRSLCKKIGYKQTFKVIHVAGTNGKGSTCATLSAILSNKYKVGLYTSPHLVSPYERIQINGRKISRKEFDKYAKKIIKNENEMLSFFEFLTCIALKYFQDSRVDIAVIEVGMGGRLDATNIVSPSVEIITSIGIDHTNYLGQTVESIAKEKAGIIKRGVVISSVTSRAKKIIEGTAIKKRTKLIELGRDFHIRKVRVSLEGTEFELNGKKYKTNLIGRHQARNVSDAIIAARQFVDKRTIEKGISKVKWPARFEVIGRIILDGAHNVDGARAAVRTLNELKIRPTFVIAIFKDKQYDKMIKELKKVSDKMIFTTSRTRRSCDPNELARIGDGVVTNSFDEALKTALSSKGYVCVIGSLHNAKYVYRFVKKMNKK